MLGEEPLLPWLKEMQQAEREGKPVRIVFDRADRTTAAMSLDEYLTWKVAHPEEAREHPSTIAND